MRPKTIIVVIDPHEDRQGVTRFSLWVNGFYAIGVPSISAARDIAAECDVEVFLGYWPLDEAWFAQLGKELRRPTIYMASRNGTVRNLSDATLTGKTSMAELVERITVMSARKRGPRPIPKPVAAVVEAQEALNARA